MASAPHDRSRRSGDGGNEKYTRPPPVDRWRAYGSLHHENTPDYHSRYMGPLPNAPPYRTGVAPAGPRDDYHDRRQFLPPTSFPDQYPVVNGSAHDTQRGSHGLPDRDINQRGRYPNGPRENPGGYNTRLTSVPRSGPQTSNKRPAPSPGLTTEYEHATKRQRQHSADASSILTGNQKPNPSAGTYTVVGPRNGKAYGQAANSKRAYINATTQTERIQIPSSKLALLEEEEAIAQAKHQAEMARRKQALDLELDHERNVLELRRRFEMPMAKTVQVVSAANGSYSPIRTDVSHVQEPNVEGITGSKDGSPVKQTSPETWLTKFDQEIKIMGASQNSSIVPQDLPKPDIPGEVHSAAADASSILDRLLGTPPDPSTQNRSKSTLAGLDKRSSNNVSEEKDRPKSASPTSVHIKTSVSPVYAPHGSMEIENRHWPKVKHLTCYFWKNGQCTKSADECSYAHYDTGAVAMAPDSLKRFKRNGSHYRRGPW